MKVTGKKNLLLFASSKVVASSQVHRFYCPLIMIFKDSRISEVDVLVICKCSQGPYITLLVFPHPQIKGESFIAVKINKSLIIARKSGNIL